MYGLYLINTKLDYFIGFKLSGFFIGLTPFLLAVHHVVQGWFLLPENLPEIMLRLFFNPKWSMPDHFEKNI